MTTVSYPIQGGDYARAGSAASSIKQMLKQIGVEPAAIRRTMIATYEAEMNVVVHAASGLIRVRLDPGQIDVEVVDQGPGIPDIALAMTEGFSTAPDEARELGFGAGMGLPNIRRNSDHFTLESTAGRGTQLRFTIRFAPQAAAAAPPPRPSSDASACRGCLRCVRVCPTKARRLRGGQPQVLSHLCIGCGACIAACPQGALGVDGAADAVLPTLSGALVVPEAFLAQFGPGVPAERVVAALRELGCDRVVATSGWELALRQAVVAYARAEATRRPVISPVCPAVVHLIALRFPSLLPQVAPFESPVAAVAKSLAARPAACAVACPAQQAELALGEPPQMAAVSPKALREAILPRLAPPTRATCADSGERCPPPAAGPEPVLEVSGLRHVARVLDDAENGRLGDITVVEPYACDLGCCGSPLLAEDPFVARRRRSAAHAAAGAEARAVRRRRELVPRPGLRLDGDMRKAIEKLSRIDALAKRLPGSNCGLCGAPTCAAFAEDVVMGRAAERDCVVLAGRQEDVP